ncbi:hypothetical protein L596_012746 [Steinernema carpocapsae]|uniref:Uncharacterized protein n=1 Tax=Steinernema carpocapsae TaxID=34508 RepID=A0A4U5NY62_STECR|nr:hypothetical protein L596_012746 [Steinernema carpocapsae]
MITKNAQDDLRFCFKVGYICSGIESCFALLVVCQPQTCSLLQQSTLEYLENKLNETKQIMNIDAKNLPYKYAQGHIAERTNIVLVKIVLHIAALMTIFSAILTILIVGIEPQPKGLNVTRVRIKRDMSLWMMLLHKASSSSKVHGLELGGNDLDICLI